MCRFVISAGDIYNFHFVKNEKVVSIRDCGGTHFSIPLNSEIQFGLLYNPGSVHLILCGGGGCSRERGEGIQYAHP